MARRFGAQRRRYTMRVIGGRELEHAVVVRLHGKGNVGVKPSSDALTDILEAIKERKG